MRNTEVAKVFSDIADLLDLKGEIPFKIRAYQRAAKAVEHLPKELGVILQEGGNLRDISGVGEAIGKKITELVATGRLEYYDRLQAEFPEGMSELLEIPGVGPRTAMRLASELGIKSVEGLERSVRAGEVATLPGLGERAAGNILHQIQALRRRDQRIPLGEALPVVEDILSSLAPLPGVRDLTATGSVRRRLETVGDIDLMGTADRPEEAIGAFTGLPVAREVLAHGPTRASIIVDGGLQVDLRLVEHERFGSLLQYFTGSKGHNLILRERGNSLGLTLTEYGITPIGNGVAELFTSEEALYRRLGLSFIPPELREGGCEVEMAGRGAIPALVEVSDVLGDLHVHSDWSDGHDSIETMARAARERGYTYLAITDHSGGLGIARGLSRERLERQMEEVRELDRRLDGIRILSGTEVNIRADGSLDFPDELLAQLDIVVAGVHSGTNQPRDKMTRRIIGAIENPHVDVLAHPTCRLLGGREPIDVDLEAVFGAAVRTGTALEINAMPMRLDLRDTHISRAREMGVKLAMGTDAHRASHLDMMRFGVGNARRGWCEPRHILNTGPLGEIQRFLGRDYL
ncbi:MAG: DNA polymerase/3'-5' exonuclease PolX [Dehalococcoidia bacterium]